MSAPDTPRQDARCNSLGAHLTRVMLHGWCPCGWNGDPRTEADVQLASRDWGEIAARYAGVGATPVERELRYLLIEACKELVKKDGPS